MKLSLSRCGSADYDIRSEISEDEITVLRLEAGLELHDLGHRLWTDGERKISSDCLRIAARCELPEAEIDLLVWRATKGREISDCTDVPAVDEEPAPRDRYSGSRVAMYKNLSKVAVGVLSIAAALLGAIVGHQWPSGPGGTDGRAVHSSRIITGKETKILPPMPVRLTVAPVVAGQRTSSRGSPAPPPRRKLYVDLRSLRDGDYAVALSSAKRKKECRWSIVGTHSNGPRSAAHIALEPGASQTVTLSAGEWSSLSVFSDTGEDCGALGMSVPDQHPPSPAVTVPTQTSATPAPTEATVAAQPSISPPVASPTPTLSTTPSPSPTLSPSPTPSPS